MKVNLQPFVVGVLAVLMIFVVANCGSDGKKKSIAMTVTFVSPLANAEDVPTNSSITAIFSRTLNASTVTTSSFVVEQGGNAISGSITVVYNTVVFTPATALQTGTTYIVTAGTDIKSVNGRALKAAFSWEFRTGSETDATAPTVDFTIPGDGVTGYPLNASIRVGFSEDMDPLSITTSSFTVADDSNVSGTVTVDGDTAIFSPEANLNADTTYTATITTDAADLAGNSLADDYTWTFTTGSASDTTAPTVNFIQPADGANNVSRSATILASFDEAIDPLTVTGDSVTVSDGSTNILGTVHLLVTTITFTPLEELDESTTYTASIDDTIADLAGNTLTSAYTWDFTTEQTSDTIAPTVSLTTPLPGSTGAATNAMIIAAFSEPMNSATLTTQTFILNDGTSDVSGSVSYSGLTAIFTPDSDLDFSTAYDATITTGATDLAGNALSDDFTWSFTTAAAPDTTAPEVVFTNPQDADTDVSVNSTIRAVLSESLDPSSISSTSFLVNNGLIDINGSISLIGKSLLFQPDGDLEYVTSYTATLATDITDLAGNALAEAYTWTFTTGQAPDLTPPLVTLTNPSSGATGVGVNTAISASFSEAINPESIDTASFFITDGTNAVEGVVSYLVFASVFTPLADLEFDTEYTATLTTQIEDLAGNRLEAGYIWSFTTGNAPDATAPAITSTAPRNNAVNIAVNGSVRATFTEPMKPSTINTSSFTLSSAGGAVSGTVTYSGLIATFTPNSNLASSTLYTATITTAAQDLSGNSLAANYVWGFTTGTTSDTTPPEVCHNYPYGGLTNVARNTALIVAFNEPLLASSVTASTFTLTNGSKMMAGTVLTTNNVATFIPAFQLSSFTTYTFTVTTGVKDVAGNKLVANHVRSFTTGSTNDTTAPTVRATRPLASSAGIERDTLVTATFSELIRPSTLTAARFTLSDGTSIAANVSYISHTAVLTPLTTLSASTTYTATIATQVLDLAGNPMTANYSWTFTTGAVSGSGNPELNTVDDFAVVAGRQIVNSGPTTVMGDMAVAPFTTVIGFPPGVVTGTTEAATDDAYQAKNDLANAFIVARRKASTSNLSGSVLGQDTTTLSPGVYWFNKNAKITGTLTLDAGGDPTAVFIIQTTTNLELSASAQIVLANSAQAENVFFQVGTSVNIGTGATLRGNVMACAFVVAQTNTSVPEGRLLSLMRRVEMKTATVSTP